MPFLSQMLSALPAGETVDSMAVALLDRGRTDVYGPTPSEVSARALMSRAADSLSELDALRIALIAGATNRDTVDELLDRASAFGALPDDLWSVLCNPLAVESGTSTPVPPYPSDVRGLGVDTRLLAVMGAAVAGKKTNAPRGVLPTRGGFRGAGDLLERHWPWESLTQEQQDFVAATSRQCAVEWEAVSEKNVVRMGQREGDPDRLASLTQINELFDDRTRRRWDRDKQLADLHADPEVVKTHLEDLAEDSRDSWAVQALDRTFGRGQMNTWLTEILDDDSMTWSTLVRRDMKPLAGRHVGARLYEVTGDDPGLWSVALDLLESWDRPLPEWLDAVAALN